MKTSDNRVVWSSTGSGKLLQNELLILNKLIINNVVFLKFKLFLLDFEQVYFKNKKNDKVVNKFFKNI